MGGWGEARRGGASWAETSQAGSAEGPRHRQPVGVRLLKGGEGDRGQQNRDRSAAVQARGLHILRSLSLLRPPSLSSSGLRVREQAAITKLSARLQLDQRTHAQLLKRN